MEERLMRRMIHAIGLDNGKTYEHVYEAYRNGSFYDEPDELWDDLVVAGYAYDRRKEKDYRYSVTPKGFQLLADHHKLMIQM